MKLRRALAAAAATAVIAPVALIAAPAAYADGHETTSVENTETPAPEKTEVEETEPPAADGGTEGDDTEPPATDETGGEETGNPGETGDDETETPATDETGGEETGNPGETEDEDSDTPGGDEDEETETPDEEFPDEEFPECEANFQASLSGFPNKIVAGSGWKEFSLNLDNSKGEDLEEVIIGASVLYKKDIENDFEGDLASKYAQFQYFDGEKWSNDLSDGGNIGGFLPVSAGEKVSLQLRLSISAQAPAGSAVAIAFGIYADENNCSYDEKWYDFEVIAAGGKPGNVNDAKPQTGKSPVKIKPQGDVKEFKGQLAETGSSSALPMFGLAGAAAVALGAGAMYVVRRRNGAGADTSAAA
ncbi:LAETG motif-containing sortase-dependent surface protein [Streptomyces atacamensis]|uniref:LAETG motif-containing sortase-dependent surface protein n=1 Tax=Streptomyces atacamensis TaxID=531966 RepID=UPI00399C8C11